MKRFAALLAAGVLVSCTGSEEPSSTSREDIDTGARTDVRTLVTTMYRGVTFRVVTYRNELDEQCVDVDAIGVGGPSSTGGCGDAKDILAHDSGITISGAGGAIVTPPSGDSFRYTEIDGTVSPKTVEVRIEWPDGDVSHGVTSRGFFLAVRTEISGGFARAAALDAKGDVIAKAAISLTAFDVGDSGPTSEPTTP